MGGAEIDPEGAAACPSRRLVLKLLASGLAGGLLLEIGLTAGCASAPAGPQSVTVPLDEIPAGGRLSVKVGGTTVELIRNGETIVARSLVCPHQGCIVQWRENEQRYKCPCQEAYFDADGKPVMGPANRPLDPVPVVVAEGSVTVTVD